MTVLITGGAGFIGSHLAEELANNGFSVKIFDNLHTGKLKNLENIPHDFIQGDINDIDLLVKSMKNCQIVFHLAALTSVIESMHNPNLYVDVNTQGTVNVLKAAKQNKIKKVIFASSAAVYGDSPQLPKIEDMPPNPKSPYAISKLDGELYCKLYSESFSLPTAYARFFNVFGEKQDPNSHYAAAIPIFLNNMINNKTINIYGDGEQTRDFIYVKDVVNALIFLIHNGQGLFNIGYGKTITINNLLDNIKDILDLNIGKIYTKERPGEIKHSYASVKKLNSLGFIPNFSLKKGLERTAHWIKTQI